MTQASQSKLTLGLVLELLRKRSFPATGVAKVALLAAVFGTTQEETT